MKILYVASDQKVPGRTGGSVHVEEVARGLSALGHEVHVVALLGEPRGNGEDPGFELHPSPLPLGHRAFRWMTRAFVERLIERIGADAVMERYYNFGGEGIRAAHERGVPSLLEVNSPLVEHEGSLKGLLDRLLLVQPMKRARERIAMRASALATPLEDILPDTVPREKIHRVSWGANVERFRPDVEPKALGLPPQNRVVVFQGSFRPWHGADVLLEAAPKVLEKVPDALFLFVGSGPALPSPRGIDRVVFTGAVPHAEMPAYLRAAEVGVAPYQPSRLGQMKLGFFWSPLKIFEYMASGLPVVALDAPPLREIVRPGEEGLLVPESDPDALAAAITRLLLDRDAARAMGQRGRDRVVAKFSWSCHCQQLDRILRDLAEGERR